MMVARLMFLITTTTVAKHHHNSKKVLESKENFFGNVNVAIHSMMDNLFESIGLATNFSKESNTKLLLTMHYDLSNIQDKNFDTFHEIQNIIQVNVSNKTQDAIKLDTVVSEVLNENHFDVYNVLKGSKYKHKHSKKKTKDRDKSKKVTINPSFGDSREFADFVIKFLAKVNNLTIQDFKRSSKYGINTFPTKKNLKVWDAPKILELDSLNTTTRRIFRGVKTQVSKFPFVVSIHIMGEFACAGCIINRDLIITAASCLQIAYQNDLYKNNLKSIYVRLGSDYTSSGGETIPVQNLYFHPEYEPEHLLNNLALLRLEKRIRFSRQQKRIRRIVWDKTPESLSNDTKSVIILGWGATKTDEVIQKNPRLAVDMLDVYDIDDCRETYSNDFVTKENFCAGFTNRSGGACNGDVGGPGIIGAVLVGIISFGAPVCGKVGAPTVLTKLGYYVPWIESITNLHNKENLTNSTSLNTRRKSGEFNLFQFNITLTDKDNNFRFRGEDYPEEVKVLRDVLIDLVKTDKTVVDEVIYGDLYDEFNKIFKSKEQTESRDIHIPVDEKSYRKVPVKIIHVKNHLQNRVQTTTSTKKPMYSFFDSILSAVNKSEINYVKKDFSYSEDETDNDDMKNDYTDNYEKSSDDERGLSIEVPRTFTLKYFAEETTDKSISRSESMEDSLTRISDASSENSNENKKFFARNREHSYKMELDKMESEKTESDKTQSSSIEELTTRVNTFAGTRIDYETADNGPLSLPAAEGEERARTDVVTNDPSENKPTSSVHDNGKSLATRPYFIDIDSRDISDFTNKYIRTSSTTEKSEQISSSKKRKHLNRSSKRKSLLKTFIIKL